MKKIYKYKLPLYGYGLLRKTQITRILKVGEQHNVPVMWCEIDTDIDFKDVSVRTYQTGEIYDPNASALKYAGTFTLGDGKYIGHVYATV